MSDDAIDITELAHDRDSEGELLPVTETADVLGETVEIEIYPATTGQQHEWQRKLEEGDDEGVELADSVVADLLDEFVVAEPSDFGADSWADVRPAITDAMAGAVLARLFDAEDTDEFVQALDDAVAEATQGNPEPAATD